MSGSTRLLVVAPHATRTGSTRVLIDLLRGVLPRLDLEVSVLVQADGPLRPELESLGSPPVPGEVPDVVFVNSCLAASHLEAVPAGVPTAIYVHETGQVLRTLEASAARCLLRADCVLAVSQRTRRDLEAFGVAPERLQVLPPVVPPRPRATSSAIAAARAEMAPSGRGPLVLACGEASERKGSDLFVELGIHLARRTGAQLTWLGRRLRADARLLEHDTEATGQADRLRWLDSVADPDPYLAAADVVVVTSREDPQPLVPLEAAVQGTPTVGFDLGGIAELAEEGAALAVAYPDAPALADAVCRVLDAPDRGASLVEHARERLDRYQVPQVVVPRFEVLLRDLIASRAPGSD